MNINKYIHSLIKQLREPDETTNINEVRAKLAYARAYKNGDEALKRYRDRAIAAEIGKTHDKDAQFAILFNKETEPKEYEAYQAFRAECKARVDARMDGYKKELEVNN